MIAPISRLITERGDKQIVTSVRECSALRAPVRALVEYLGTLEFQDEGNKVITFTQVVETKADPETQASYPSCSVYSADTAEYVNESAILEPIYTAADGTPDGWAVLGMGEIKQDINVHVWTTESTQREQCIMMLEDAFNPVEWATGFMLEMPHYHGLRASYTFTRLQLEDVPEDNFYRYRKAVITLTAYAPYVRRFKIPKIHPRASGVVTQ